MRFRLYLMIQGKSTIVPYHYPYLISSWIYRILNLANPQLADWLHRTGMQVENKRFKLFTFSQLRCKKVRPVRNGLRFLDPEAELELSFYLNQAVESFILGVFEKNHFRKSLRK